ncbi:HD family phosphohydrolase [Candidatus Woesearchaeota archaeon CG10_big_fil_rev_8_21_14_0_10_37_12]|nr:MAG: HD family phosphohydrolase [Candidatus Woesearchaeota archaeon CG10_big_fil_rev_8_21_14_0_10_37_12]
MQKDKLQKLKENLKKVYFENKDKLLFHGWHHIEFVRRKSLIFAEELNADLFLVESAALVHDLNYIVKSDSKPEDAKEYRAKLLDECSYSEEEVIKIENIVLAANTFERNLNISNEAKAISDADSLFKVLPTTLVLFSSKYITENRIDFEEHVHRILAKNKFIDEGTYFYTKLAKQKYSEWAKTQHLFWEQAQECIRDTDTQEMLKIARELDVI